MIVAIQLFLLFFITTVFLKLLSFFELPAWAQFSISLPLGLFFSSCARIYLERWLSDMKKSHKKTPPEKSAGRITKERFCALMLESQYKNTASLKAVMNEIGYDDHCLVGGCDLVSFWIVIRAIHDKVLKDEYFKHRLKKFLIPKSRKEMDAIFLGTFRCLDEGFNLWAQDPQEGRQLGEVILKVANGIDSEGKCYEDKECLLVFSFFAHTFDDLIKKAGSLQKQIV